MSSSGAVDHLVEVTLASSLDSLDDAENYRDWIMGLARPYLEGPIVEIGAGHGTFTRDLAKVGSVTALEPGVGGSRELLERFDDDDRVCVVSGTIDDVDSESSFASAVMINVLEHIDDDADALRSIYSRLAPGGHLVLWVPAFEFLYGDFDDRLGHERRYRRPDLVGLVEQSGYIVVESRYVNLPGWFSWLLVVRLLSMEPTSASTVRLFDRLLVPMVRRFERWVRPPFGQSIFLVARRPLEPG